MHVLYLFFIAVINSLDNIGIGIAYSMAGMKIPLIKNLLISSMAFLVSFFSALSGDVLSHVLSEETASLISMLLLFAIGLRMIWEGFDNKTAEELQKIKVIQNKEALTVGTVLAIDDIGGSMSSGLIGYGPFAVAAPFFIVSFIIFFTANFGTRIAAKLNLGKRANAIAGILMILLGVTKNIV